MFTFPPLLLVWPPAWQTSELRVRRLNLPSTVASPRCIVCVCVAPGFEPKALESTGKHSITELHFSPLIAFYLFIDWLIDFRTEDWVQGALSYIFSPLNFFLFFFLRQLFIDFYFSQHGINIMILLSQPSQYVGLKGGQQWPVFFLFFFKSH